MAVQGLVTSSLMTAFFWKQLLCGFLGKSPTNKGLERLRKDLPEPGDIFENRGVTEEGINMLLSV